jgi:chemotaxis protein MotD
MTRAGTVAEQPPMAPKTNTGRLRDAGVQKAAAAGKDATAPSDEVEKEFVELLSKLSGADGKRLDRSALPEGSSRQTNLRQVHQHEIAVRFAQDEGGGDAGDRAADDCSACDDLQPAKDPAAKPEADTPEVDVASPHPPELPQIAAILAPTPIQSPSGGKQDDPAGSPGANRAAGPAVPTKAVLDASVDPAETNLAPQHGRVVKGQSEQDIEVRPSTTPTTSTTPTDPTLTRAAAPEAAIAKGQSRQDNEGRPLVGAKDSVRASASEAPPEGHELPARADVPKASVLKRETHFAPVSPHSTRAQSGSLSAEGRQVGAIANTDGKEPRTPSAPAAPSAAAAPSADAASLSAQGPASIATPAAQQIAERIAAEAPAFGGPDRAGAGPDESSAKPVLKIVQIQLQPADLGTVTVRIELKAADLKLHVETDRSETADIIRSDQNTLSKLLRSAGYGVDAGSIRIVEGDRSVASAQGSQHAGQQGAQTNLQSSTQSHPGGSGRQEGAPRDQRGAHGGNTQTPADRNETHGTTTNRTGRGLYI